MATISPNRAEPPLVLALDVGTSSIRAMIYDRLGRAVEGLTGRASYDLITTPDGGAEAPAEEMVARCVRAIDTVLQYAGSLAGRISAVGMDTLVSNVLGVDADGRPVTPVYTWADTRSADEVELLRSRLDEHETLDRTGVVQHTSYLPARFLWLQRTNPQQFARVRYWMSIGEYILLQLFGERRVSYSVASWTGLLNRYTLDWDAKMLELLPITRDQLSPLSDLACPFQSLSGSWTERWPALRDIPWFPACGDGVSSNIGSGGTNPTRVVVNLGTSGAMRVVVNDDRAQDKDNSTPNSEHQTARSLPWGLWSYRVDARRSLLGGALSNGGNLFAWMHDVLNISELDNLEAELGALEPDAHGLTMLPFLAGERSTGWNPHARAAITGLSLNTSPVEIVRAGMETVAYRFALIYELLQPFLPPGHSIIASGGALLNSPTWTQILTDVLGIPVVASDEPEATSRGVALLTLEALGVLTNLDDAPVDLGRTYTPDAGAHTRYASAITRHRELYHLLIRRPGDK